MDNTIIRVLNCTRIYNLLFLRNSEPPAVDNKVTHHAAGQTNDRNSTNLQLQNHSNLMRP